MYIEIKGRAFFNICLCVELHILRILEELAEKREESNIRVYVERVYCNLQLWCVFNGLQ